MLLWPLNGKAAILAYILYLPYKRSFKMITDLDRNILKIVLTVSSDNTCSVKAGDPQNKKNEMEKWAYFTIRQKL